jgi:hypothetical protein
MTDFSRSHIGNGCFALLFVSLLLLGCTAADVRQSQGPTISEARATPALGHKARIGVGQIVSKSRRTGLLFAHCLLQRI